MKGSDRGTRVGVGELDTSGSLVGAILIVTANNAERTKYKDAMKTRGTKRLMTLYIYSW